MLYNLIGDIHGRDAWRQLVREDAVNIFMGDYLDPYGPEQKKSGENALKNLQAIVAYKEQHPDTILLLGNHDLHYLWRECYSRYNYQCAKLFAEFFRLNWHHFQLAYAIGKRILVTHAGVTNNWCELVGIPSGMSTAALAARLNQMVDDEEQRQCFTALYCGMDSAGYTAAASPIWVRPEMLQQHGQLLNEDGKSIVQIVGHTKTDSIQLTPPFFFVDCLATSYQSLLVIYENGGYDFDVYKPYIAPTIVPYRALVLNIPHASTNIPEEFMPPQKWHKKENSLRKYQEHARYLIDYYTDELFSVEDKRIKPVVFDLCRTLCDVERMVNDPLENDGYGIVCSKVMQYDPGETKCSVDYNPIRYANNKSLLLRYLDYQNSLATAIVKASCDKQYLNPNSVLLIDCHSFSSMPTALCHPGPAEQQVDICLGYNDDDGTCPPAELIDLVASYFEGLGYRVGRNTPFSHSKTVECPVPYHSLMIEVNKRCYMCEQSLAKTDGFARLRQAIEGLYGLLL